MDNHQSWHDLCHTYGLNRIEISKQAKSGAEWDQLWGAPKYEYPLKFGPWWKMTIEYKVLDYAAEVGFYIDFLGLSINALSSTYAMFSSPDEDFQISIVEVQSPDQATPVDSMKLEFMVEDVDTLADTLKERGLVFEREPSVYGDEGSNFRLGTMRTPHGILLSFWSAVRLSD